MKLYHRFFHITNNFIYIYYIKSNFHCHRNVCHFLDEKFHQLPPAYFLGGDTTLIWFLSMGFPRHLVDFGLAEGNHLVRSHYAQFTGLCV